MIYFYYYFNHVALAGFSSLYFIRMNKTPFFNLQYESFGQGYIDVRWKTQAYKCRVKIIYGLKCCSLVLSLELDIQTDQM